MIRGKTRNVIYTFLFCFLILLGLGMGVFALSNAGVQNYFEIAYYCPNPVLSKAKFQDAYNGESEIYFDYYDDYTRSSYTKIAGGGPHQQSNVDRR
ncbi:MAG: hypothetical protein IJX25_03255 [Clostridia bacterium]|nr:hypothetical protein [Clostridia bacterium]